MATKAGVWIDHKQAIVVLVTGAGREIKKIAFDIGQPIRPKRSARSKNDYVAEDTLERRVENDRKDYYKDVIDSIGTADALLILGPGEAKGELNKQIIAKKVRGLSVELETTDKMTERQIAAKVNEHFQKAPARKSVVQKKTAKTISGKRTKKTGK